MSEAQSQANSAAAPAESAAPVEEQSQQVVDESTDEGSHGADDAIQQASTQEQKRLLKKYGLTVNGKQKEIELDLFDDNSVKNYLQKAMASEEKFQEAAMTRKQAEALVEMLRKDPLKVLTHPELGLDVKALAQKVINQELEEMALSPEQKKIREMESKLKEHEERAKQAEDAKRKAEIEKIEREQAIALDEEITTALSQTSLPKSPYTVKRVADAMIEAIRLGYEDVNPSQVMAYVEAQIKQEMAGMFGAAPDKIVEELVGKGRLDSYRKERVAKAKAAAAKVPTKNVKDTGSVGKKSEQEEPKIKFKDLFRPF